MLKSALINSGFASSADGIVGNTGFFNFLGGATTKNGTAVSSSSAKTLSAFALALTLIVITLGLNFIALRVVKKYREQYD